MLEIVKTTLTAPSIATRTTPAALAGLIHGAAFKNPADDPDEFGIADSGEAWGLKKITWANIKASLKSYFDTVYDNNGFLPKEEVRAASTANLTLSGTQTVDGIALVDGDACAALAQTAAATSGVYIVHAGAWTRRPDMDASAEFPGALFSVRQGTIHAGEMWTCTNDIGSVTLGTTPLNFVKQSSSPALTAGSGIVKVGNQVSADIATIPNIAAKTAGKLIDATSVGLDVVVSRTVLKTTPASLGSVFLGEGAVNGRGARSGRFTWNATVPVATHQADAALEGVYVAPNPAAIGAWVRQFESAINPEWFGAVEGLGKTAPVWDANRAAIQAPLDLIENGFLTGIVTLPVGAFEFSGTIHVGRGVGLNRSVLVGQGRPLRSESPFIRTGTALIHTGPITGQAINTQGGRHSRIANLSLKGTLHDAIEALFVPADRSSLVDPATWTALGGDDRYSPYAGITVDAFAGTAPATPYLGATYGRASTSSFEMEEVEIDGFNTGFVCVPANTDAQGDFTNVRNMRIVDCMYAFSVGNSQSRNVNIDVIHYLNCHTVFTNNKHGKQNGRYNGIIRHATGGQCSYIFDFTLGNVFGGVIFEELYSEAGLFAIGKCGDGTGGLGVTFQGGIIAPGASFGTAPYFLTGLTNCPVVFDGTCFSSYPTTLAFQPANVRFLNGCFATSNWAVAATDATNLHKSYAHNATAGGIVTPLANQRGDQEIMFRPRNVETGVGQVAVQLGPNFSTYVSRIYCCPLWQSVPGRSPSVDFARPVPRPLALPSRPKSTFATCTLVGKILTFTYAAGTYMDAMTFGWMPGDVLIDNASGSVFWVKSYTGPVAGAAAGAMTIVAELQNNLKFDGVTVFNAFSTTAGNLDAIISRLYVQDQNIIGDTTGPVPGPATAIITNVGNLAGSWSFGSVAVGDVLPAALQRGLFTTANSRVTAVDTAARTITMGGVATRTSTREDFTWWMRSSPNSP